MVRKMIDDITNTWLKVIKTPGDFFMQMPAKGGYADPVKFAVICYLIAGIFMAIIPLAAYFLFAGIGITEITLIIGFSSILFIPVIGVIGLFIGALILHIFFKILGGKGTYDGTFRILAYASATAVFIWIPFVGILAGLYMIYVVVIGGTKVHKISTLKSVVAVVMPVVIGIVIIVGLIFVISFFSISSDEIYSSGEMYGDSSVTSAYDFRIVINTDSKLENLTFYTPLPLFNNESKLGEQAIIQTMESSEGWNLSMIETEHGTMLKFTAIELVPELNQLVELNPSDDSPTGEVHSFTRGTIEVSVSMAPDNIIDTRNATDNEPVLFPKYNMILSDIDDEPYPSSRTPPKTQRYESFIYADYTASTDANVEICVRLEGRNEWWKGGWTSNSYRDHICTTVIGEKHGWIPVTGEIIEGEGRYD
jgi:hypothetical protein